MALTLSWIAARAALVAGAAGGVVHGLQHAAPRPVDPDVHAACVSHLPGSGARCGTDRFVADVGPHVLPALTGGLVGLALAVGAVVLVRALLAVVRSGTRSSPATVGPPAWTLAPAADRATPGGAGAPPNGPYGRPPAGVHRGRGGEPPGSRPR